jgi:hypothetical protein
MNYNVLILNYISNIMDMKHNRFFPSAMTTTAIVMSILLFLGPMSAFAHERTLFTIGEDDYLFVIGSIGEPVFVDDKSGVELAVYTPDPNDPTNTRANNTEPVEGLEEVLQVELIAGDQQRIFNLEPAWMQPGNYEAVFYPTIATTYGYRVFGDINGTAFDYTWECNPAGHVEAPENANVTEISENVTRQFEAGQFGCPVERADLGFPEPYVSNFETVQRLQQLEQQVGNETAGTQ